MRKIKGLGDVQPKEMNKILLDPISCHLYNNRDDYYKRDSKELVNTIEQLVQHIAYLEVERVNAETFIKSRTRCRDIDFE